LPVEKRPFGQPATDDQYRPVPEVCIPTKNQEPGTRNIPKDRILILEDTDNDGVADKRTVFVEGLDMASAILCGDDGIYVGQQPHLPALQGQQPRRQARRMARGAHRLWP